MNEPRRIGEQELDRLVRVYLDQQAEAVEPGPRLARIAATLQGLPDGPTSVDVMARSQRWFPLRGGKRWLLGGGVAAAAALVFIGMTHLATDARAHASPQALVQEARRAHQLPVDRSYLIEIRKESNALNEDSPMPPEARVHRLWTRGEHFWIESINPKQRWAWGQDEQGVWIAFGSHIAIRFDRDEVPRPLAFSCDILSMRPEKLLDDVLRHFDLSREESNEQGAEPARHMVRAIRKPGRGQSGIRSALLELDPETKVVRRLVLERAWQGQLVATVTYTLVETRVQQENRRYQLEGHVSGDHEIYTRDFHPERRRDLLLRWLGPEASERWRLTNDRK